MVLDWCPKDSGTGMSGMGVWSLPDLIAGGEGRRSDCVAGSVPSNRRCVEHLCQNGNSSDMKLNPAALGCCKISFVFQSVVLRATTLPTDSCVFSSTSLRWCPPVMLACVCQRRVSQQLLINLQKEIPIRRSRKKCAHQSCS